jgi:hypothetical protein
VIHLAAATILRNSSSYDHFLDGLDINHQSKIYLSAVPEPGLVVVLVVAAA